MSDVKKGQKEIKKALSLGLARESLEGKGEGGDESSLHLCVCVTLILNTVSNQSNQGKFLSCFFQEMSLPSVSCSKAEITQPLNMATHQLCSPGNTLCNAIIWMHYYIMPHIYIYILQRGFTKKSF